MKVTILGAGNSGCAHAAKLVENGHEVKLVKTSNSLHEENFECVQRLGGILMYDETRDYSFFAHFEATKDVKSSIEWADVIMVLTQSLQHRDLAEKYAHLFKQKQIVFIIPGNLGSLWFRKFASPDVYFAEAESTPYDARIVEPGCVHILFKNTRNAISISPNREGNEIILKKIDQLFDSHKYLRTNIVETAMHNPNMVVHTIGTIMSASRIEMTKGEFWMYREAFSDSVWNLVQQLDAEKNAVIEAYGGQPLSYLEACKWRNEQDLTKNAKDVFQSYAMNGGPKGPISLKTRFVYEDVPMGLCQLECLAQAYNIATPIASSLINIASALMKTDFRKVARDRAAAFEECYLNKVAKFI